jgi:hypothetical protein
VSVSSAGSALNHSSAARRVGGWVVADNGK